MESKKISETQIPVNQINQTLVHRNGDDVFVNLDSLQRLPSQSDFADNFLTRLCDTLKLYGKYTYPTVAYERENFSGNVVFHLFPQMMETRMDHDDTVRFKIQLIVECDSITGTIYSEVSHESQLKGLRTKSPEASIQWILTMLDGGIYADPLDNFFGNMYVSGKRYTFLGLSASSSTFYN